MKSILLGTGLALLSVTAANAIDCTKTDVPLVTVVCNSPDAVKADDALNAAYDAALKLASPKQAKILKDDQKAWFDLVDNCVFGETDGKIDMDEAASCLTDYYLKRTAYLTGAPIEGPGFPDALMPVVYFGADGTFEHLLRFGKPKNRVEKAFNAEVDNAFKEVFVAKDEEDTSDYFDMTLPYAGPELISANVDIYLDGEKYAHPMPSNFSINVDAKTGKVLSMDDMLDKAGIRAIEDLCTGQLKDYVASDTEGADKRQGDIVSMATNLDLWSFGAKQAVLSWVDYFNQDDPPKCTVSYDVLRPLIKSGFPLPA